VSRNVDFGDAFTGARAAPRHVIEPRVTAFPRVRGRLHLGLGRLFDRFARARVERSGSASSLKDVAKRFLRRFNLDGSPRAPNVISREMSLVGPRPHALAHDQLFERRIALYARLHNVKSGAAGRAWVNGPRGEIRRRIAYDLQCIDNWSLTLDIRILFLTVFSRKAYRNAV